jgi:hypothetical protein
MLRRLLYMCICVCDVPPYSRVKERRKKVVSKEVRAVLSNVCVCVCACACVAQVPYVTTI